MKIYSIQTTLTNLENSCRDRFNEETQLTEKDWHDQGGGLYIGVYPSGTAMISGPLIIGNPTKPWFEVQASDEAVLLEITNDEIGLMRDKMRSNGILRAAYRLEGRQLIRNGSGNPIGVMPRHVICGTNPAASYLDDEDIDIAQELLDLEL